MPMPSDEVLRTYGSLATRRPLLAQVIADLGVSMAPEDLAKEITVTPEPNTTVLDIAVQDTSPLRARDIANALTADLIAEVIQSQQQQQTAAAVDSLIVLSPATRPERPVSPSLPLNIGIAFAGGLVLALGLAAVPTRFIDRLKGYVF